MSSCYYYFFAIVFFDFGSKSSSLSDLEDSNCKKTAFCSAVRPTWARNHSNFSTEFGVSPFRHCNN